MLKIMVIDDEENIRLGIVEGIDWEEYEVEVVCQAGNGRDALVLADQYRPDIILVDINMPFVNGLEFSQRVKIFLPESLIIILSGYSEFEYAKESIKNGVSDYLLKPVSPRELISAVVKARDKILDRNRNKEFVDGLKQQLHQSIPILREKMVFDLLHASYLDNEAEMNKKLSWLNINFPSDKFSAFVVQVEDLSERISGIEEDKQLYLFAIKNICDEVLNQNGWGLSIVTNEGLLEALVCPDIIIENNLKNDMTKLAKNISVNIKQYLGITVLIETGNIYSGFGQINYSYREAYNSLKHKYVLENSSPSEMVMSAQILAFFPFDKEMEMVSCLKYGNERALQVLDEIFCEIDTNEIISEKSEYLVSGACQIINTVLKLLTSLGINSEKIYMQFEYLFSKDSIKNGLDYFKTEVHKFISVCLDSIIKAKGMPFRKEIEQVKKYIEKNYKEDISLKDIAASVYMNPNYLCTVFKSDVGDTINNYTIKVRMEKAKELLITSNLKIFEIAEKVGYSNTNYFSYAFKKYTGIAPNEYK